MQYNPHNRQHSNSFEDEIGGYGEYENEQAVKQQRTHRPARHLRNTEQAIIAERLARQQAIDEASTRNGCGNTRLPQDAYSKVSQRIENEDDELYADEEPSTQRPPRSAIRFSPNKRADITNIPGVQVERHVYNEPFIQRKSRVQGQPLGTAYRQYADTEAIDEQETEGPAPKPKRGHTRRFHFHPLVWLGLGMIVMFLAWVGLSNLVAYGQQTLDDWHYLRPRVFQTTAVVGASDSPSNPTYFEALNLNRHVYIFECPGGDCTKARIINGPTLFGDSQDLSPITITFKDVDGNGKLDMIVHVEDHIFVMINDGAGNFRPLKAGERIHF